MPPKKNCPSAKAPNRVNTAHRSKQVRRTNQIATLTWSYARAIILLCILEDRVGEGHDRGVSRQHVEAHDNDEHPARPRVPLIVPKRV